MTEDRVRTGIDGLDAMLGGGFLPESANLVEGAPGTGKTVLGLQFIYNGITLFDQPGLILAFEEFPELYYQDALSFGWDLAALEESGELRAVMTSPEASLAELQEAGGLVQAAIQEIDAKRVLVDSISHFRRLTADSGKLRHMASSFINNLKREGVTSILTQETDRLLGAGSQVDEELAFLADSYILLRYVEMDSAIHKALLALKVRGTDHAKDIRRFEITADGIQVRSRFEGQEAIMSGSPRKMADSFVKAFVKKG